MVKRFCPSCGAECQEVPQYAGPGSCLLACGTCKKFSTVLSIETFEEFLATVESDFNEPIEVPESAIIDE
jgi:hypothetical protein